MTGDWDWKGGIFRSATCPGSFVWTAQHKDGLTGAFGTEPGYWQTPWQDVEAAAAGFLRDKIAARVPGAQNLRLAGVQRLPRASLYLQDFNQSIMGLGTQMPADRGRVDYLAEVGGRTIRIRADVYLNYYSLPMGQGWEASLISGAWAPDDQFAQLYPIGRGVRDSLRVDRKWNEVQMQAVQSVLKYRKQVHARAHSDWDGYIRGMEVFTDPETGEEHDVPRGPGKLYKDRNGTIWRVYEGWNEPLPADWREIRDF